MSHSDDRVGIKKFGSLFYLLDGDKKRLLGVALANTPLSVQKPPVRVREAHLASTLHLMDFFLVLRDGSVHFISENIEYFVW